MEVEKTIENLIKEIAKSRVEISNAEDMYNLIYNKLKEILENVTFVIDVTCSKIDIMENDVKISGTQMNDIFNKVKYDRKFVIIKDNQAFNINIFIPMLKYDIIYSKKA